jgi:hypothetical protein
VEPFFEKIHGFFPHIFRCHDFLHILRFVFTGMYSVANVTRYPVYLKMSVTGFENCLLFKNNEMRRE